MRIFVGIPAFDRKLTCETVRSLLLTQGAANIAGIEFDVCFAPGSSLITHARNHVVRDFLASGADRLVFVDADIAWDGIELIKLASHQRDFVGGVYRHKNPTESYPINWIDRPELWSDASGLIEVARLPTGFLSLSRGVFERTEAAHPERKPYAFGDGTFYPYFHIPPGLGEDYAFCDDWRAAGGEIWLDPSLTLTHVDGAQKYTGCIGDWLRSRMKAAA